eukprot:gene15055-21132_t
MAAFVNSGPRAGRVVLYDGLCNLCNNGIRFVANRDPNKNIMFCSVQSHAADRYLLAAGLTRQQVLQRFVFLEYKDVSEASTAALRVASYMQQPWPMAGVFTIVPVPVRDTVYDYIAKNRACEGHYVRLDPQEIHRFRSLLKALCTADPQVPVPVRDTVYDHTAKNGFVDRDELMAGLCRHDKMDEESNKDDKDDKPPKDK